MSPIFNINKATKDWAQAHGIKSQYSEECESTNKQALNHFEEAIYTADRQTQGRGRFKREWSNSQQAGDQWICSFSFLTKQSIQPESTLWVGWWFWKTIREQMQEFYSGENSSKLHLKVPNDLFLKDFKVAGILVEAITKGNENQIVVGIGLNLFSAPQIAQAGSLFSQTNSSHRNLSEFWNTTMDEFYSGLKNIFQSDWLKNPQLQAQVLRDFNLSPLLEEKYSSYSNLVEDCLKKI